MIKTIQWAARVAVSLFVIVLSSCMSSTVTTTDKDSITRYRPKSPNIVLVVADDLGWRDLSFMGTKQFSSPNIDNIAKKSMVFDNAYAGASNCAPSRAVLMSGQYAPRTGIYTVGSSNRGKKEARRLIATKNTKHLSHSHYTLAQMFKDSGYTTAHIGKWHLGDDPKDHGFDFNIAGHHVGHPKRYFSPYKMKFLDDGPKDEYLTDRLTDEAIGWIDRVKSQPFFLYLPYYSVHTPLQAKEDTISKYKNNPQIDGNNQAKYAAMIEHLDDNVGRLAGAITRMGLSENTVFVFTSDNGGKRAIAKQTPLRAGKGSYFEGGIRVPLFFYWPGKIKAKTVSTPTINADFFPTFARLIGANSNEWTLDGIDLSNLLLNNDAPRERALFWHFPVYLQAYKSRLDDSRDPLFRTRPGSAMRKGRWKLHHYFEDDAYELYDLETDLGERVNIADHHPGVLAELKAELVAWRAETAAPIPTKKNPAYQSN